MILYSLKLPSKQITFLKSLEGTVSQHIRTALNDYINKQILISQSPEGEKNESSNSKSAFPQKRSSCGN